MFISSSAHQKFLLQCKSVIDDTAENEVVDISYKKAAEIKSDIDELQKLAETYSETLSEIPPLSKEYYFLLNRIRIKLRLLQREKKITKRKRV